MALSPVSGPHYVANPPGSKWEKSRNNPKDIESINATAKAKGLCIHCQTDFGSYEIFKGHLEEIKDQTESGLLKVFGPRKICPVRACAAKIWLKSQPTPSNVNIKNCYLGNPLPVGNGHVLKCHYCHETFTHPTDFAQKSHLISIVNPPFGLSPFMAKPDEFLDRFRMLAHVRRLEHVCITLYERIYKIINAESARGWNAALKESEKARQAAEVQRLLRESERSRQEERRRQRARDNEMNTQRETAWEQWQNVEAEKQRVLAARDKQRREAQRLGEEVATEKRKRMEAEQNLWEERMKQEAERWRMEEEARRRRATFTSPPFAYPRRAYTGRPQYPSPPPPAFHDSNSNAPRPQTPYYAMNSNAPQQYPLPPQQYSTQQSQYTQPPLKPHVPPPPPPQYAPPHPPPQQYPAQQQQYAPQQQYFQQPQFPPQQPQHPPQQQQYPPPPQQYPPPSYPPSGPSAYRYPGQPTPFF